MARIRSTGPISFAEFMAAALYDPEDGYYTSRRSPWGSQGDYITAPQVHPALGRCVARYLGELDGCLGGPDPLVVVEVGSGDGRLMAAVLGAVEGDFPDAWRRLQIWSVDAGPSARSAQRERLHEPGRGLRIVADIAEVPVSSGAGLVLSNELYDALPVERVRGVETGAEQMFVGVEGERLVGSYVPASTAILDHLVANGVVLEPGQVGEVCLAAAGVLAQCAARLDRGAILTIDYGHETATLYDRGRHLGTLLAQQHFRLSDDILADPGRQDLTAHVDFGNLRRAGRELGWEDGERCSLRVFLLGLGAAGESGGSTAEQMALRHLLVSEIGDLHQVLVQVRGLAGRAPTFGRARLRDPAPGGSAPC